MEEELICSFPAYRDLKIIEQTFLQTKDSEVYRKEVLLRLNKIFCFIDEGLVIGVIDERKKKTKIMGYNEFPKKYKNFKIIDPEQNFEGKTTKKHKYISINDVWMDSMYRKEVDGVCFSAEDQPDKFNMYIPGLLPKTQEGDVTPILEHIQKIWCRNCPIKYNYIINWLAFSVQKPFEKIGVALVLGSQQGAGKGIIIEKLEQYYGQFFKSLRDSDALGQFNGSIAKTFIIFFDESHSTKSAERRSGMKRLITEKLLPVEYKGKDVINIESACNVIIATNNIRTCEAEAKARRYYPVMLDNRYAGISTEETETYMDKIIKVKAIHFIHYLKTVDISKFNPRKFEINEDLMEQMHLNLTCLQSFWYHILSYPNQKLIRDNGKEDLTINTNTAEIKMIEDFRIKANVKYEKAKMVEYYQLFAKHFMNKSSRTKDLAYIQFFKETVKLIPSFKTERHVEDKVKLGYNVLPSIEGARKEWIKHVGYDPFTLD